MKYKSFDNKARELLYELEEYLIQEISDGALPILKKYLKEQDRDTRHACAERTGNQQCINVKAG